MKILLMYISANSGHYRACLAIENALHLADSSILTKCINSFRYTNPILEKVINTTYMVVIKKKPQIWEYLYDNPNVVKKTENIKKSMHRFNSAKMKKLIDNFKPDCIVCTQAFPCGIVADLKKSHGLNIPLVAVLTDYAPHAYWIYDNVDAYVVPSEETGRSLIKNGIPAKKIKPLGMPVDPKFYLRPDKARTLKRYSLDSNKPIVLIMGGGQGLGPIKRLLKLLDRSPLSAQFIVVTGSNKKLYRSLTKKGIFKKRVVALSFTEDIHKLMDIATLVITKPGGITTAEALSKALPMIILNPLPGQETLNTRFLVEKGLGVRAQDEIEASALLDMLLRSRSELAGIKARIQKCAKPRTSHVISQLITRMAS